MVTEPKAADPVPVAKEAPTKISGATVTPHAPEPAAAPADESLLADFAQAVEGQKAPESAPKSNDNEKLLAEFENFNKKS